MDFRSIIAGAAIIIVTCNNVGAVMRIADLGTLGGSTSSSKAMNKAGVIAGQSTTASGESHAFLWQGGTMKDIGAFDVIAINDKAQVIGKKGDRSYFWSNDVLTDLGTLGGIRTTAYALNDHGDVVGESHTTSGDLHAFLWHNGVMTDLGALSGDTISRALDINNSGVIVGTSGAGTFTSPNKLVTWVEGEILNLGTANLGDQWGSTAFINELGTILTTASSGGRVIHGYLLRNGHLTDLYASHSLPAMFLTGLNNQDQVAGYYAFSRITDGFFWKDGINTFLGTPLFLGSSYCSAVTAMNNDGTIVGNLAFNLDDPNNGFMWKDGTWTILPKVKSGVTTAVAINDSGEIAGTNAGRAVLWTEGPPIPDSIGMFRLGAWYLDKNNNGTWDNQDLSITFGNPGDRPVVGHWDGTETAKIGVYRSGAWYLDMNGNGEWDQYSDKAFSYGIPTDVPVVGNWRGGTYTAIGVFRDGTWYLDNGDGKWDDASDIISHFGIPGDVPVTGDWTGSGTTKIGVVRGGFTWYLDMDGNGTWEDGVDAVLSFGAPGDVPVTGDWNGTGTTKIGVVRSGSTWYLDANGNGTWDAADQTRYGFGVTGDVPIRGKW